MTDEAPSTISRAVRESKIREEVARAQARAEVFEERASANHHTGSITAASAATAGKWVSILLGPATLACSSLWFAIASPMLEDANARVDALISSQAAVVETATGQVRRDMEARVEDLKAFCSPSGDR